MSTDSAQGKTAHLVQLCAGYFFFYVITGLTVKYFMAPAAHGFPGMNDLEFLVYSTAGGNALCLGVVLAMRWYRLPSRGPVSVLGLNIPQELLYLIPSGICTAVVIPATTLLYTLPISVMVIMVIMRGAIIIVSRLVDAIQIRQGLLKKRVSWEENVAVGFALLAISTKALWAPLGFENHGAAKDSFSFIHSPAALTILGTYILAYALRIYIMNYYKNTRGPAANNTAFFAVEQIVATSVMLLVGLALFFTPGQMAESATIVNFQRAFTAAKPSWPWAIAAGGAYGMVAFFSVFIFMFKGRTATFAGLVNRLTSLLAGTGATLLAFFLLGSAAPRPEDWVSLGLILVAVVFLARAELKTVRA